MLHIAVCDDEPIVLGKIVSTVTAILQQHPLEFAVTPFESGDSLVERHKQTPFDVLFLDIDMPGMSGFEVAKEVRTLSSQPYVIFITAKHDLVYQSFEFQPFYFVCKSQADDLNADLAHVIGKLLPMIKQSHLLAIPDKNLGSLYITLNRLLYIKSEKHYLMYHLVGDDPIPIKEREQLPNREKELQCYDFLKPHQRYLVNMHHIRRIDLLCNTLWLSNGETIPISANVKEAVFEKYRNFLRR